MPYYVPDIQDYFEYIIKKHEKLANNQPIRTYVNKTENRVTFKIRTGYYLELLIPETMKLPKSTENKIIKDKNGKNVLHFQITDVILVLTMDNNVSNGYQPNSRVFNVFVSNKFFGNLLEILA